MRRSADEGDDREAARLLAPLRAAGDGDLPGEGAGGVDVARAIASGRRRARARRAAAAAGAVCAVALVVVAAALLGRMVSGAQPRPAGPGDGGFDVLRQEFAVSPAAGLAVDSYETGRWSQRIRLAAPGGGPAAVVTMHAPGRLPAPAGASVRAAPDVAGHRARWLAPAAAGEVRLAWEWRGGAWGVLALTGGDRELARAVAGDVAHRPEARVEVPFTVEPSLPGRFGRPVGTVTSYGAAGGAQGVAVRYGLRDGGGGWVAVGVAEPAGKVAATATRWVRPAGDGRAVYAEASDEGTLLRAGGGDGLRALAEAVALPGASPSSGSRSPSGSWSPSGSRSPSGSWSPSAPESSGSPDPSASLGESGSPASPSTSTSRSPSGSQVPSASGSADADGARGGGRALAAGAPPPPS
ncbi:hypothetical protein GCM10027168_52030 [Streptomyces capparidis]